LSGRQCRKKGGRVKTVDKVFAYWASFYCTSDIPDVRLPTVGLSRIKIRIKFEMSNFRRRSPKRRLYSFDRQYAAERRPREYPAVQKTDDVSRAASGDQCSFAHAFDAPCQQERQQRGNRYERDVESDFEFSEIRIIAPRGV